VRLDSPFVLASAGTIAIHLILIVVMDATIVIWPYRPSPPAPRVDLIDVEVPPPPPPEPPKPPKDPPKPLAKPVDEKPIEPAVKPMKRIVQPQNEPPPTNEPPRETVPVAETPGGDEVVTLDDVTPSATGVAVKVGKRNTGQHIGRGGNGGGTGAGSGAGTAEEAPPPVSVATIKKRAMPKGDYGYFNTGADYPAAAKQLGLEGDIRVRLIVDDRGKVKQAVLLNKLGHGLDELALSRAKQIEFEPAKDTEDRAVTSVVIWTFHMTLPK
jgi:protein TonB